MTEKTLLVTGASSEVGMRLIRAICGDYGHIFLHYANMNDELAALIDELGKDKAHPIQADLRDMGEVEALIGQIHSSGHLPDAIVHLPAPKAYNGKFHKYDWELFEAGWEISVRSIVAILKDFIPAMAKKHYGRVVFMLTSNTLGAPAKYQSGYVTVKYALLGLMKALSTEYAAKGITVNGVSPDMMETKFLSEIPELIVETNAKNSPLGRNISIDEVIPAIKLLLSDEGAAITGQNIGITGGL